MSELFHVPFVSADREFEEIGQELLATIESVLRGGQILNGEPVYQLENALAVLGGRKYGRVVNSGTDALYFALVAAGVGEGDEVLLGDLSFVATVDAILRAGATPVFVDVDDDCTVDLDLAAEALGPRTKALVAVQLYGRMTDPYLLERFARENGLLLIEDAAQSLGAAVSGRRSGSVGVASCHSFDPMKVIPAPGTGGVVLTDDPDIAERVEQLRRWGFSGGDFVRLGHNSQMSSLTAAVIQVKLKHEERWLKRRRTIASTYSAGFDDGPCRVPEHGELRENVYHKYVLRTSRRDALAAALRAAGIETHVHYPYVLHELPFMERYPNRLIDRGRAKRLTKEVISLPIHPFLTDQEVDRVVTTARKALDV
ncbi:DegT/DnrJ/EryC1/StrS family aminotransferase [Streptomyces ureilyticus]|uniref:Aminotransferase class I/II-fold pyridoxal phosphate-dependent enzyme n=1 Tax=Streptomyces ureilyticus TaxID=1775131 RepID=A0ABX0DQK0_9ACTN|nr:aminotransferase class I/II-fold pyridoxal phosphate-dependent enzyme [Streptomyces ureilyticus]NGO41432.1 aminotransferase class I/II-fold pyridoxal phosphate-dependent enzyme [Streptomyces ureilyticus]